MSASCIMFAGGGSGGHLSPGLAIDERLREIAPEARSRFLCSDRAIDATMLREAAVSFSAMPATPPGRSPAAAVRFLRSFARTRRLARRILRDERATTVVALGGFVAAPIVRAARAAGVPVLLVNLDSPPGKANRWMARHCDRVVSAVPLPEFPGFASQIVGLPVRRRAIAPVAPSDCRIRLGLDPFLPTLLITGASQGATSVNTLMAELARTRASLLAGWQVLHLTGHGGEGPLRDAYGRTGVQASVQAFVHDMGLAWGAADLAISRAGANSVAEIAVNAVPTIFLPYPHHADMHQRHNAQPFVDIGGAVMLADRIDAAANVEAIAPTLERLMRDSAERARMRDVLRSRPGPDAAMTIARIVMEMSAITTARR